MNDRKPTFWSSMLVPFKSGQANTDKDKASLKRGASIDAVFKVKKPRPVDAADSATTSGILQSVAAVASNRLNNMATAIANTDSDDDVEPVVPQSLHWRSHPELSDWTIEVWTATNTSDVIVERYPVHKSVLALESLLFAKIFTEEQPQTTRTICTRPVPWFSPPRMQPSFTTSAKSWVCLVCVGKPSSFGLPI
jgi:hypothetical protein